MIHKINYKSDYMSRKQDEQLEQLEDKLTALYANATNDIKAEFTDFMSGFSKQDEAKRLLVETGNLSEDEYAAWRRTQILYSTQYSKAVESMTTMLVNTDVAAMAMINGELPVVVAQSYDFVASLGFAAADQAGIKAGTFQIYNAETVQALVRDNPDLLPKPSQKTIEQLGGTVDIPEDKKWSKDRINREITQGIVKGESIPKVADRLGKVTTMSKNSAVRNARTAMTAAENMGRSQAADDLKEQGIPTEEVWSATYDNRTRDTHLLLDGTTRDASGYFGVGIIATPLRFPADPAGDPEEIYNCRCRLNIQLQGIDHSQDGSLYEQFMKENYPDDWKALQENEAQQARNQEVEAAKARKEDLRSQHQEQVAQVKEPEIITKEPEKKEEPEPVATSTMAEEQHQETERPTTSKQIRPWTDKERKEAWLEDTLNMSKEEAQATRKSIYKYTNDNKENYSGIHGNDPAFAKDIQNIDAMLNNENMPIFDGTIYRGIHIEDSDGITAEEKVQAIISGGTWNESGITSFSSDKKIAERFSKGGAFGNEEEGLCVLIVNKDNKTGCPIQHLSASRREAEVLVPSDIKDRGYTITNATITTRTRTVDRWWDEDEPTRTYTSRWAIIEVTENGRK